MNLTYSLNASFAGMYIDFVEGRVCGSSKISVTHITANHQSYLITRVAVVWSITARVTPVTVEKTTIFWGLNASSA